MAVADSSFIHIPTNDLPPQREKIVITAPGIVKLGELLARSYLSEQD